MIAFLLYSLLSAASNEAATTAPTSFPKGLLIGGKDVGIDEVPYQAIISYDGRPICGGVIISKEKILTSAHCLINYGAFPNDYKVRVGSSLRDASDGRYLRIRDAKRHESFAGALGSIRDNQHQIPINDLAMIITEPMNFDAKSQPIKLFDEAEAVEDDAQALVTGWSRSNGSERLVTRTVRIVRADNCGTDYYQSVGRIPAGQICATYAGPSDKHACLGDSGGPLVLDGRLAGILSWGNGCVKQSYPGVYTEIAYYRDWIDNGGRDIYRLS